MLRTRIKRQADQGARAKEQLALINASIAGLHDEDLLDLADIFKGEVDTPIAVTAFVEMARRNISL